MPRQRRTVINAKKMATDRLPEWANEGAILVEWMHEHGVLGGLRERLKIQREGGYTAIDLVVFLLFFLTCGLPGGIKGFGERSRPHRRQLAALGGRKELPSPSSISRILSAAEPVHGETVAPWLLFDGCDAARVMEHPSAKWRDAEGDEWHVFDLDPTVTVLRQRALPELDDLPPARRRAAEAKPGYPGRKRGQVQLSRMTLGHAGSGLWMGLWMAPGNGEWREHSEAAVQCVRKVCDKLHHPTDHAVVRVDGAGGNVPFITACQEAGVRYVTRWSEYEVLDRPDIRAHLNTTTWYAVEDSGTGPRREAAEVGWLELRASVQRADGSCFAPVRARLVVSRFRARKPDKKRGAGVLIDGWQYELYATDLQVESWPTDAIVTGYYGRCGEENRFGQEDRELGLDHLFSYNVAGQQLANLIGLFIWNLRVCRGMELEKPPTELPDQRPSAPVVVESEVTLAVDPASTAEPAADPASVSEAPAVDLASAAEASVEEEQRDPERLALPNPPQAVPGPVPSVDVIAAAEIVEHVGDEEPMITPVPAEMPADALPEGEACSDTGGHDAEAPADDPLAAACSGTRAEARSDLRVALNMLDWCALLEEKPGWRWNPEQAGPICPDGHLLHLQSIKIPGLDRTRSLRFLAPYLACTDCPVRAECTASKQRIYRKELAITVPTQRAYGIHRLLARSKGREPPPPPAPPPKPRRRPSARRGTPKKRQRPATDQATASKARRQPTWEPPHDRGHGTVAVIAAILLPAELRKAFARACRQPEVHVHVHVPKDKKRVGVFALTPAERQCRRLSWTERDRWNEFPDGGRVRIVFAGGAVLVPILQWLAQAESEQSAA